MDYLNVTRSDGSRIIRKRLAQDLTKRQSDEPRRYPRFIDAAFLNDEIDIICNPTLYEEHFRDALNDVFPLGCESARDFLKRLVLPRNALYHANALSVHDAYRVLCYTLDVTEALKAYYTKLNMEQQYNVPTVIRIVDSLGHMVHLSTANRHPTGSAIVDFSNDVSGYLRCGDTLSIDVEVDPTFNPNEYQVNWLISNVGGPQIIGTKFQLYLAERYVSTRFCAVCHVRSNKSWHKMGDFDDQIDIAYRVLPPP
jgi:hypothetical protein